VNELITTILGDGIPRRASALPWSDEASMVAWAMSLLCGLLFLVAVVAWARKPSAQLRPTEHLLPLAIVLAAGLFSFIALPHSDYSYDGEDALFVGTLEELEEESLWKSDPLLRGTAVRKMGRLHLGAVLAWQAFVLQVAEHRGWDLSHRPVTPLGADGSRVDPDAAYVPLGPDPPYGWRVVGLATWALASWFLFGLARRWGAGPAAALLGVALCMSAPALLFHANCLSDHLAAAVVIVLGLHLQLRRLADQSILTGVALVEGLVILGAAFYTHWTSLFLLVPLALMRLLAPSGSLWARAAHIAGLGTGALVIVLPELPRIVEASQSNLTDIFVNYLPEAGLGLMSYKHLISNLSPGSLAAFLAPAGEPAFIILAVIGACSLWAQPPPGGRKVLAVLGVTVLGVLGICYTHIHPGSRWLLPLTLWMTLLIARGLQTLLTLPQKWRIAGRVAATLVFCLAVRGALSGMTDLKEGWFAEAPPHFALLRSELPHFEASDLPILLAEWSLGTTVNIVAGPVGDWTLAPRVAEPGDQRVLYTPPVLTWTQPFRLRPTIYLAGATDYGWSTRFERDYLAQMESNLNLRPAFVSGPYIGLLPDSPEHPRFMGASNESLEAPTR